MTSMMHNKLFNTWKL